MPILALGVSYRSAAVELLGRLAFPAEDRPKAYHELRNLSAVRGGAILSTCNRVEVFAEVDQYHGGFQELRRFLSESRDVPAEDFGAPLYAHYEDDAAEHLFSVAAGVDSMVLGEPQILSQVGWALKEAREEAAASPLIEELFRRAVRVGKLARSKTRIGASPAALVEAGADVAERTLGSLAGRALVVVGAGTMSELAARTFLDRGVARVLVLNRTQDRAERMARRVGGEAGPLGDLGTSLEWADLVVSSTGAPGTVVGLQVVEAARRRSGSRPLFLLDLGVPRDVDPAVGRLAGVEVADVDDLRDLVAREDRDEVERVRAIVAEEVASFAAWRRAAEVAPVLQALYDRGERVRLGELARARGLLSRLSEDERAQLEALTRAIVAKLLHHAAVRAKELSADEAARLLSDLFDLDVPKHGGPGPGP